MQSTTQKALNMGLLLVGIFLGSEYSAFFQERNTQIGLAILFIITLVILVSAKKK